MLAAGTIATPSPDTRRRCRLLSMGDANGLDFNPRVEPKANASCDAERPPSCQGVPVNQAAREGNRCRPINDGAPASRSRRKKVRPRRRMDAKSALGRITSALRVGGYEATREA